MAITEFCAYCGKIYFYVNMKLLAEMPNPPEADYRFLINLSAISRGVSRS